MHPSELNEIKRFVWVRLVKAKNNKGDHIGEAIKTRQQGETWGKSVVINLSQDLQAEFSGIGGFSAANLWRMKLFYETYVDREKLAPLV